MLETVAVAIGLAVCCVSLVAVVFFCVLSWLEWRRWHRRR